MTDRSEHHAELNQLYVLRLWRESTDAPWRAVLRPADGGERIGFADMEHLTLFLLRLTQGSISVDMSDMPSQEMDS